MTPKLVPNSRQAKSYWQKLIPVYLFIFLNTFEKLHQDFLICSK